MAAETASTDQLFSAIAAGDIARVTQALDADPALGAATNADGVSPLLWSLYTGHRDIAEIFLTRLPEATLTIHEAAAPGRLAHLTTRSDAAPESVNAWSPDGFQPLGLAALFGQSGSGRPATARGAEVDTAARHASESPLHSAPASPKPGCAHTRRRRVDVNKPQPSGATRSTRRLHRLVDLTEFPLAHVPTQRRDNQGRTPAQIAQSQNHPEVAAPRAARHQPSDPSPAQSPLPPPRNHGP
jgi:ankyrin repeat protein